MANRRGKNGKRERLHFGGLPQSTADAGRAGEMKRRSLLGRKAMTNLDSMSKSRDEVSDEGLSRESYGFSSGHVQM
jgi:hypothetical protein